MKRMIMSGVVLGALLTAQVASAQSFPAKPVRMVTEFVAGSGGDTLLRITAAGMSTHLGQPVLIENRAGAGGVVAAEAVSRSAPDGYTLLGATPNVAVVRVHLAKSKPFSIPQDLTPITTLGEPTIVIIANPALAANNLKELIELAKREPGKLSYATSGVGSTHHLSGEQIKMLTGVNIVHVPYKALAESIRDVVSGQIPVAFNLSAPAAPMVKAGKLKVLAINNLNRHAPWPEVMTVAEQVPGFEQPPSWTGLLGPGNLPQEVLRRVHGDTIKAMNDPEVKSKINAAGFNTLGNSPEEFLALIKRQIDLVGRIAKSAGIQPTE